MACLVFLGGPDIQQDDAPCAQSLKKLRYRDRRELLSILQKSLNQPVDFSQVGLADAAQREPESAHLLGSQPVIDRDTGAACLNQARRPQYLQVLGSTGNRDAGFLSQGFNCALSLRQHVEQFQSMSVSKRLAHTGKLLIEQILKRSFLLFLHKRISFSLLHYSIE